MYIRRDFVLTNAALGEDLRSNDGRSVVKVTHQPLPPHFGDDSDSEFDSDLDIDDDEELDEDEFELDEEEGFKLTPKPGKAEANGEVMDEDDEEEEDDDEEDEDDEDFSDDEEVEETNVICSLTAGKVGGRELVHKLITDRANLSRPHLCRWRRRHVRGHWREVSLHLPSL